MTWAPKFPSLRGMAAVRRLAEPSTPQPLEGSVEVAPGQWWTSRSAEAVIAEYTATSAPLPAESTVLHEPEWMLRVTSPMRESAIMISERGSGSLYTIVGAPTLQLRSNGLVPDVDAFVRVAGAPLDATGLGFVAQIELDGAPWVVTVMYREGTGTTAPEAEAAAAQNSTPQNGVDAQGSLQLVLAPGALQPTLDFAVPAGALHAPCSAIVDDGQITASATIAGRSITVRARLTNSLSEILPEAPATLTVSKKWGRHGSRPWLTGGDFGRGEQVTLSLGGREMATVTADESGQFTKMLQVPRDVALGHTEFTAQGAQSEKRAAVPYEVRPPKAG
jgi:hypothetical protein